MSGFQDTLEGSMYGYVRESLIMGTLGIYTASVSTSWICYCPLVCTLQILALA